MSKKLDLPEKTFFVCMGSKCSSKGGKTHYRNLRIMTRNAGKKDEIQVVRTMCTGNCKVAPVVGVMPKNKWYGQVNSQKVEKLFAKAVKPKKNKKA